jgi:hypothetical protein
MSKATGLALLAVLAASNSLGVRPAYAAPPVALVEDVAPQVSGIALMDYLEQGRRLDLGANGWIEIDYFSSCLHERIVGGSITVGAERSDVSGGSVERHQVECDAGKIGLTEAQTERSAGFVQRGGVELKNRIRAMTDSQLVLHGASPLVIGDGAHDVVIARFGNSRDRVALSVTSESGRRVYDFATHDRSLTPGGVYVAICGERQVTFRIDREAKPGQTPVLGRLVAFPPAS